MVKKSVNKTNPNFLTVGIDIGYGVTKVVTEEASCLFPSVLGYGRDVKFGAAELVEKHPGDQLFDDDGHWFVGDLALRHLRASDQIKLRGRGGDEWKFRTRLAKVALGKLRPNHKLPVDVVIATGLPVDHMPDAGKMKEALLGMHYIHTDTSEFVANVVKVMVMPQPYGTIYANMLNADGTINECHTATRTGVCDVGTYTVDVALDDDGEYVDALSGSFESGVYTAQERISEGIEREYRQKPDYKTVDDVLRTGCLKARGKSLNFAPQVEEALSPLRSATLSLIADKWKTGLNVDVIYLSGGGAELVYDTVKGQYPQTVLVDKAQLANARGYLSYALFDARG